MAEPAHHRIGYEDTVKFVTSLCLTYTLCVGLLRGWIQRGIYGYDDAVIGGATILAIGHFAAGYVGLEHAMGKPWSWIKAHGDVSALNGASISSVATFSIALYLSKAAAIVFLLRLTKHLGQRRLYYICLGVVSVLGLASVFLVTVGWPLNSGYYWAFSANTSSCSVQTTRWAVWTTFDILTEVLLLALPLYQVWNLQMPLQRKATVVTAFWLRLPVIALSIGRQVFSDRLCRSPGNVDFGLESSLVLIWMQIEVSYAIISSTFSALKAFTMSFNSTFGLGFTAKASDDDYAMSRGGASRVMRSQNGSKPSSKARIPFSRSKSSDLKLDQSLGHNSAQVSSDKHQFRDGGESPVEGGDDMVIVREMEYSVRNDPNDEDPILYSRGSSRV